VISLFKKALSSFGMIFICILLVFTTGCATYSDRTKIMRDKATSGDYNGGLKELNGFLKVEQADELPSKWDPDDALLLLERGSILMAQDKHAKSATNFKAADDHLEMLDIANDTAGNIGKYIYSDSSTKYRATPIEKLALNEINMMNYLAQGNLQGAQVEARRFTVMRGYLNEMDKAHVFGVAGSYLSGFLFEQLGDFNRSLRYYDEALQKKSLITLKEPLARLSGKGTYRGKNVTTFLEKLPSDLKGDLPSEKGTGEILVIANVGRVPYKEPQRVPVGAVIGLYGTFITGDPDVLAHSVFKVVVYPELVLPKNQFIDGALEIDGKFVQGELLSDLSTDMKKEYEALKPKIMGAAISRLIARAVSAEVVRKSTEKKSEALSYIAALVVEGAMVAADKPDTRSWTLLPGYIYVARKRVKAGQHTVALVLKGQEHLVRKMDVNVPEGGFAAVVLTTLR
jgi:tetratricopeptide (TPR) repeat protein